jgi:hypothetical protein
MVEAGNAGLSALLAAEKDWARSAIFTDTKEIVASHDCNILPDELE